MFTIKRTAEFDAWLFGLRDTMTRIRLAKRLDKVQRGDVLVVMLGGGDKSTQQADIQAAITLSKTLED